MLRFPLCMYSKCSHDIMTSSQQIATYCEGGGGSGVKPHTVHETTCPPPPCIQSWQLQDWCLAVAYTVVFWDSSSVSACFSHYCATVGSTGDFKSKLFFSLYGYLPDSNWTVGCSNIHGGRAKKSYQKLRDIIHSQMPHSSPPYGGRARSGSYTTTTQPPV